MEKNYTVQEFLKFIEQFDPTNSQPIRLVVSNPTLDEYSEGFDVYVDRIESGNISEKMLILAGYTAGEYDRKPVSTSLLDLQTRIKFLVKQDPEMISKPVLITSNWFRAGHGNRCSSLEYLDLENISVCKQGYNPEDGEFHYKLVEFNLDPQGEDGYMRSERVNIPLMEVIFKDLYDSAPFVVAENKVDKLFSDNEAYRIYVALEVLQYLYEVNLKEVYFELKAVQANNGTACVTNFLKESETLQESIDEIIDTRKKIKENFTIDGNVNTVHMFDYFNDVIKKPITKGDKEAMNILAVSKKHVIKQLCDDLKETFAGPLSMLQNEFESANTINVRALGQADSIKNLL
jgi:hypothetical protein